MSLIFRIHVFYLYEDFRYEFDLFRYVFEL